MIIFKKIWGKNFLSFEYFELVFVPGKHLILGTNLSSEFSESNGSGKSSIIELISWVIYKITLRSKNVSRDGKGDCSGGVLFDINDDSYEVIRYQGKKNDIKFTCNGEDVSPRNNENVDDVIERTIGIPYDLFVIVVTILQGLPVNLSSMTPTIRKGVIEAMMGLDNWEVFSKLFQKEKNSTNDSLNDILNNYTIARNTMISKNAELETVKNMVTRSQSDLNSSIKNTKKQLTVFQKSLNNLESKREMITDRDLYDLKSELGALVTSYSIVQKQIEEYTSLLKDEVCPTCGQSYPEEMLSDAEEKLNLYSAKLSKIKNRKENIASIVDSITSIEGDIYSTKREIKLTQNNLDTFVSQKDRKEEKDTISIEDLTEELINLNIQVNAYQEEVNTIESTVEGLNYILSLLQPSSTFRTRVLERYLAYINGILEEVAPTILDGMTVALDIDKKANGIDIKLNEGKSDYKSLSGGEKRRVDIVIILGLQRFLLECSGINTNLLMFDEIFDNLDNVGITMILNAIDTIFSDEICLYVVTHKSEFRNSFESIIEIEKINDVSKIMN